MVAKNIEGFVGEPFELDVERGKISEFALATHAHHPSHFLSDGASSPATFLTTRFFWMKPGCDVWHETVQMDQRRGLHAEQEFIFHGPPPKAGTRLIGQSRVDSVKEKQGRRGGTMTFVTMVTEYRDLDGTLVAEARLTGVETEKAPEAS